MNNVSLNGQSINLLKGAEYIVIDALYINDIKEEKNRHDDKLTIDELKPCAFPHTDIPYGEFTAKDEIFKVNQIKIFKFDIGKFLHKGVFTVDSGVIILINKKIFLDVVTKFDYFELVDSEIDLLNINFWERISLDYPLNYLAIIVAPGISSGFEFVGSGTYSVD